MRPVHGIAVLFSPAVRSRFPIRPALDAGIASCAWLLRSVSGPILARLSKRCASVLIHTP